MVFTLGVILLLIGGLLDIPLLWILPFCAEGLTIVGSAAVADFAGAVVEPWGRCWRTYALVILVPGRGVRVRVDISRRD